MRRRVQQVNHLLDGFAKGLKKGILLRLVLLVQLLYACKQKKKDKEHTGCDKNATNFRRPSSATFPGTGIEIVSPAATTSSIMFATYPHVRAARIGSSNLRSSPRQSVTDILSMEKNDTKANTIEIYMPFIIK